MEDVWSQIREAVASRNPKQMLSLLYQENFLDGLGRQLRNKWPEISAEDLDTMIISAAVDDLYEAMTNGKMVSNPGGYLYKAANNRAFTFHKQQKKMMEMLHQHSRGAVDFKDPFEEDPELLDHDYLVKRALQEARLLLPKLGQENVQKVMGYLFDAIEAGWHDVKPIEIANALGMSSGNVRTHLSRGFDRLTRLASKNDLASTILKEAHSLTNID